MLEGEEMAEAVENIVSTTDNTVVEMLSDGSVRVDTSTTVNLEEEYYVQIQGSDRKYPAIVLRRKHRGEGATILTISKNGQHSDLYADYESAISAYVVARAARLDNTPDNREDPTTRGGGEGGIAVSSKNWLSEAFHGVVRGQDNSEGDPSSV